MDKKVIATGEGDPNVTDSITVGNLLAAKDLGVRLDVWSGWAHDWPYWKEMMRTYV
jgi:esterase/lipase superfamily enzyme